MYACVCTTNWLWKRLSLKLLCYYTHQSSVDFCMYVYTSRVMNNKILDEMKQYKMLFCVRGYHIYWDLCIGEMPVVKTNRHNNLHGQLTVASYRIAPNVRGKKLS